MTLTQQARVAGFRAQLGVRGRTLTLLPARGTFPALVEHYQGPQPGSVADSGPQVLEPETRTAVRLAILETDLGGTAVGIGDVFRDGTTDYRVVRIERGGVDVAARFTCEREDMAVVPQPPEQSLLPEDPSSPPPPVNLDPGTGPLDPYV